MNNDNVVTTNEKDGKMYQYFNGFEFVYADPFEVDYRFDKASQLEDMDLLNQWISDVPRDQDGNLDREKFDNDKSRQRLYLEACHRFIPLIRAALEVKPFDKSTGEGLNSEEILRLWADYILWRAGIKKNIESPPPSATPTDSEASSSPPPAPELRRAVPRRSMVST